MNHANPAASALSMSSGFPFRLRAAHLCRGRRCFLRAGAALGLGHSLGRDLTTDHSSAAPGLPEELHHFHER